MTAASYVNQARRAAGLSQRELSRRTGVPQSAIARIERGHQVPRADTLEKLVEACGFELRLGPKRGEGVDRREIERFLDLSPQERVERGVAVAHVAHAFGIPFDGRTAAEVLATALEDATPFPGPGVPPRSSHARKAMTGNDAGRGRRLH